MTPKKDTNHLVSTSEALRDLAQELQTQQDGGRKADLTVMG